MFYRELRHAANMMDQIDTPLRRAILAGSMREMTEGACQAETAAGELCRRLQRALNEADSVDIQTGEERGEHFYAQAAVEALRRAVEEAQRSHEAADIASIRAGLLHWKTQVDTANAYLQVALGDEQS